MNTAAVASLMQSTPRLEIRNLVRYFDGRAVVDDVSLSIQAGQVTCLLGPSGCGKSTTLRMIAGVEMQDSGEIYVDGRLICDTNFRVPPERREIGLMFQDFALFPHLSVGDNVAFGLKGRKRRNGRGLRNCWRGWICCDSLMAIRINCPVANSSGWRWLGHWHRGRGSC